MQLNWLTPDSAWRPPKVSSLPSWAGAKRVAIDLETHDPQLRQLGPGVRRDGRIVGISFAIEDGPRAYLPVGHHSDNLDPQHVFDYLKDQSAAFDGIVVGANLGYDLDYLWQAGLTFPKVKQYRDIQVAAPLVDELHDRYSMEAIAGRMGIPGKKEDHLREVAQSLGLHPKRDMWKMPARHVGEYAEHDTVLPLTILRRLERDIDEQDLWSIYDLECRLTPILVKMRRRGVAIDLNHLQKVEEWSMAQQVEAHNKIFHLTGYRLGIEDINKASAKAQVLLKSGVSEGDLPRTPKNKQYSIDKFLLARLASHKNEAAAALLRASKMDKLRNTFVGSIRRHMVNGRIHCTFNQLRQASEDEGEDDSGARYGRMSCVDPNLQQQPARDPEIGKFWRKIYIPDDGMLWAAADYSQQEPRCTYHYAFKAGCRGAEAMVKRFNEDLDADSHTEMARMCYDEEDLKANFKVRRGYAKEIFLGVTYGMGGAKLCKKLGKPTVWKHVEKLGKSIEVAGPEGQAILDNVDKKMPFLRELAKLCERRAKTVGYIKTLLGRRCRFPKKPDGSYDWCHKALNRLVQGSAGDQTKLAVVTCMESGLDLQLQVHDEIDTSVYNPEHAEKIADVMRNCVQLSLPSKVDVEIGKSWGDSM